ncbi:MAG: hypothetical protein D4R64_01170 [Porphyromonadaceae bacterium]|nr:MAG: hypothetical protein D4R64_01170 [Porphyromonadaceae bacterium]
MKTKKQLTIIILITCLLVTGIVYGEDPVNGAGMDTTFIGYGEGLGWQEQTKRTYVFISDGLRLNTGPSVNTNGFSWVIGISSNFSLIECCRMTTLKQSWCNFNEDDPRCAD